MIDKMLKFVGDDENRNLIVLVLLLIAFVYAMAVWAAFGFGIIDWHSFDTPIWSKF